MKAKVVGIRDCDFKSGDGKAIKGTSLYVNYPQDEVKGMVAERLFAKSTVTLPEGFAVGRDVDIFFNRNGKVESIALAK